MLAPRHFVFILTIPSGRGQRRRDDVAPQYRTSSSLERIDHPAEVGYTAISNKRSILDVTAPMLLEGLPPWNR
jgi:hypothetical protein